MRLLYQAAQRLGIQCLALEGFVSHGIVYPEGAKANAFSGAGRFLFSSLRSSYLSMRGRALRYLDQIVRPNPLGEGRPDVLRSEGDVMARGPDRLIKRKPQGCP